MKNHCLSFLIKDTQSQRHTHTHTHTHIHTHTHTHTPHTFPPFGLKSANDGKKT